MSMLMEHLVLRRGFLNVKGRQVKKWKKCWVKVQDGVLCYYNEQEAPNDMLEAMPLVEGTKVERAEKKESKEEFSLKIHQPANKTYVPLFLAADNESEMNDWLRDLTKSCDIGTPNIFGVDLSVCVRKNKQAIPIVVEKSLQYLRGYLDVKGIFRVSGAQSEVLAFKAAFDKGEDVDFSSCKDPHVVSNVLKLYLRELPNPLLTAELYQRFIDVNSIPSDQVLPGVKQLVASLPTAHRVTLHHIMHFLTQVGGNSAENSMPPANLAIVFGPTILRPGKDEKMEDAGNMEIANRVTERLIFNYDSIFDANLPPIKKKTHSHTLSSSNALPLPEGWVEHFTPEGRPYYYNTETKTTTWDRPTPPIISMQPKPAASPNLTREEGPRSNPGSPMTQRAKSLMFTPELISKIHSQKQEGDDLGPPKAPAGKRPVSGSSPAVVPPGAPGGPGLDADELKAKLAKRAAPKPGVSPVGSPASGSPTLTPHNPPSTLPPPPANLPLPPTLSTPPPLTTPPPILTTPPPALAHPPSNLPPPPVPLEDKPSPPTIQTPKFPPGSGLKKEGSANIIGSPASKIAATKKASSSPSLAPPAGSASPSPLSLSSNSAVSDEASPREDDIAGRVAKLEGRLANLETQQTQTNDLLQRILSILEHNNLS